MENLFFQDRIEQLQTRLTTLEPSVARARQSVQRLETEQVPAGATAQARAARLAAARAMAATLEERERQIRVALRALDAELAV
jgi:ribosomal protein S9